MRASAVIIHMHTRIEYLFTVYCQACANYCRPVRTRKRMSFSYFIIGRKHASTNLPKCFILELMDLNGHSFFPLTLSSTCVYEETGRGCALNRKHGNRRQPRQETHE